MVYELYKMDCGENVFAYCILSTNAWYWAVKITADVKKVFAGMNKLGLNNPQDWFNSANVITVDQYNDLNRSVNEMHN